MTQRLKAGVPIVRALDRGLAILGAFSAAKPRQRLSELAKAAGLDKGTARRLLQTLVLNGLVRHDECSTSYALTAKLLELAAAVEAGCELRSAGAGILREVASRTGATAFLWVFHEGGALCVDRVRMPLPDVEATWFAVGGMATLNCGAGPRVLLAFIPEEARRRALAGPMTRRTPASQTSAEVLAAQAEQIRRRGWELAADDFVVGLAGLGVPIMTRQGQLAGALSIATVTTAFGDPENPTHLDVLRHAADGIGSQILEA